VVVVVFVVVVVEGKLPMCNVGREGRGEDTLCIGSIPLPDGEQLRYTRYARARGATLMNMNHLEEHARCNMSDRGGTQNIKI
jgi:hypothetical protein